MSVAQLAALHIEFFFDSHCRLPESRYSLQQVRTMVVLRLIATDVSGVTLATDLSNEVRVDDVRLVYLESSRQ